MKFQQYIGKSDKLAQEFGHLHKERFMSRVSIINDCWIVSGKPDHAGYVKFNFANKQIPSHRFAKIVFHGLPNEILYACHTCLNKNCANPNHIVWQTPKQNTHDRFRDNKWKKNGQISTRRFSAKEAVEIFKKYNENFRTAKSLSEEYNCNPIVIQQIVNRDTYRAETLGLTTRAPHADGHRGRRGSMHHCSKLKEHDVLKIRDAMLKGSSHASLAKIYSISFGALQAIRNCTTWKHLLPSKDSDRINYRKLLKKKFEGKARKLRNDEVQAIKKLISKGEKHKDIACLYSVHASTISDIRQGRTWRHT